MTGRAVGPYHSMMNITIQNANDLYSLSEIYPTIKQDIPLQDKLKFIFSKKGQICKFRGRRQMKTLKTFCDLKIEKESSYLCRIGIEYENMGVVKQVREEGKEASGLKGKVWEIYPYILRSEKTDNLLLRIYAVNPEKGLEGIEKKYYINDIEVTDILQVKACCLASEFKEGGSRPIMLDFPLDAIIDVGT